MVFTIGAAALASDNNFRTTKDTIKKIIGKFGVDRIHYSLVTFGDPPVVHSRFREGYQKERLEQLIGALPKPTGKMKLFKVEFELK